MRQELFAQYEWKAYCFTLTNRVGHAKVIFVIDNRYQNLK
ncbi:hypothetical protein HMPREF1985_01241 [Mitsuokella sp. oral taxon 131 str. W9106]|nr:hypothetical protein HMPREF1985_01241 [Mitsuokella sp. oral taxon 131 str. W9106]